MAVTDPRSKYVLAKLIDQVSKGFPIHSLFTNLSPAAKRGESVDIPTRGAVNIEQASNASGSLAMTVQSNAAVANTLVTDKHYGAIVEIPKLNQIFDLEGAWSDGEATNLAIELNNYVDTDHYSSALEMVTSWANASGSGLQQSHIGEAMAHMMSQPGARKQDLVWILNPWGMESVRQLPSWNANVGQSGNALGIEEVGFLNGIRVVETQVVPDSKTFTSVSSTLDGVGSQELTVGADHGLAIGMTITTSGYSNTDHNNGSNNGAVITAVTSTTVTIEDPMHGSATTDTGGTAELKLTMNGLLNTRWAFSRVQQIPDVKIVPNPDKIAENLQADVIWGRTCLAGCMVGLGSPYRAL